MSGLVSRPLAAALALTTQGAGLQAAVAEIFFVETEQGAAPKKAIKLQPQCVSYSEAASGLLTGYQGTDARASLPGSWYRVRLRCLTQPRRAPGRDSVKGAVLEPLSRSIKGICKANARGRTLADGSSPPAFRGVFLPRFFLRGSRKNGAPGGRWPNCLVDIGL